MRHSHTKCKYSSANCMTSQLHANFEIALQKPIERIEISTTPSPLKGSIFAHHPRLTSHPNHSSRSAICPKIDFVVLFGLCVANRDKKTFPLRSERTQNAVVSIREFGVSSKVKGETPVSVYRSDQTINVISGDCKRYRWHCHLHMHRRWEPSIGRNLPINRMSGRPDGLLCCLADGNRLGSRPFRRGIPPGIETSVIIRLLTDTVFTRWCPHNPSQISKIAASSSSLTNHSHKTISNTLCRRRRYCCRCHSNE